MLHAHLEMLSVVRATLMASLLASSALAADAPYLLCYATRPATRERAGVAMPSVVCRPAATTDAPTVDGALLVGWPAARSTGAAPQSVDVVDELGRRRLRTVGSRLALLAQDGGDTLQSCDAVKPTTTARRTRLALTDTSGEHVVRLGRPRRVCTPTGGTTAHLVCYRASEGRRAPTPEPSEVTVGTPGGDALMRMGRLRETCIPTLDDRVPSPPIGSPPPDPGRVVLEISPGSLRVDPGATPAFTATARLPGGGRQDWTSRVRWRSSDHTIARPTGSVFETVRRGTVTVSAFDPATGITSGDASLTVFWPLERLTISPHGVTLKPGEVESFTVTGHFTGGATRNLTQRVEYYGRPSTQAVARVVAIPNAPGRRSRIEAVGPGHAVIGARDPISGIKTTDDGNDAIVRVAGPVSWIAVGYEGASSSVLTLLPGEARSLTAIGHYPDWSERNLTQGCDWSTGDPSVAVAPMPANDRSRIVAVAPGTTTVTCRDPASGVERTTEVDVLGELVGVEIRGDAWPPVFARHPRRLTARGVYAGFENIPHRGRRNMTQALVWATRDPDVALVPSADPDRSRIEAVGHGIARIYATDPATGLVSDDFEMPVYGEVSSITLSTVYRGDSAPYPLGTMVRLPFRYRVMGTFEGGGRLGLHRFAPDEIVWESSAPDVLALLADGITMQAIASGQAAISARHLPTGLVSNGIERTIEGALAELRLEPATAVRGIGETESPTAFGLYPPGHEYLVTQELAYTSSDPSVVVATNDPNSRSLLRTVGAGTATITATHPPTGVTAAMTIDVLPGTLSRITISPPTSTIGVGLGLGRELTAIGHYPDGRTLNVTQQMQWASTNPQVVLARSDPGERSAVRGLMPGTATITARHPSGLTTADTGDDATIIVQRVTRMSLTPAERTGSVGSTARYTVTGRLTDGTPVNLTQRASFWTDDANVAVAANEDGDRSAIELLAPGTVTVRANVDGLIVGPATLHVTP